MQIKRKKALEMAEAIAKDLHKEKLGVERILKFSIFADVSVE